MKKNIAKLLAALLCMALLCSAFASCDSGKKETTDEKNTIPATSAEAEEKGIWLPFVENK